MTHLVKLEHEILELHNGLTLRPTLDTARRIGERLLEAKRQLARGKWIPWLRRLGIAPRTAQTYIEVSKAPDTAHSGHVSFTAFVSQLRIARRRARAEQRKDARADAIANIGTLPDQYKICNANCKRFKFPKQIDCIATDPPWTDLAHYRWLGKFASSHLKDGGLLMVQCGTSELAEVTGILSADLIYQWTLAIVYQDGFAQSHLPFTIAWRPVLLFSLGKWDTRQLVRVTDTITVGLGASHKTLYEWEQPTKPWAHWLGSLTRPGELICDPFAGVAGIGQAVKLAGGRRYLGVELDEERAKVAMSRMAG
jgi:hypothetical protein